MKGVAAAVVATAAVGSLAVDPDDEWYRSVRKPSFQPPPLAFPIVWTALYADVAVSSGVVQSSARAAGRPSTGYERALGVNLVLNAAWTWLFFRSRRPVLAAAECAVLTASSVDLVRRAGEVDRGAASALAPYAAWCGFATVLSSSIAWLNRGR